MTLSPIYIPKARHILNFFSTNSHILTKNFKEFVNNNDLDSSHENYEYLDWDIIIDELVSLYIKNSEHIPSDLEYSCLLQQEDFFTYEFEEEKLTLELLQKKSMIFHLIEQISYKATCLLNCLYPSLINIKNKRNYFNNNNNNNISEFLSCLNIFAENKKTSNI